MWSVPDRVCFGASSQARPVFCALGQKVITSSGAVCSFALTLEWAAPCVCIPRAGSPWRPRAGAEGSRKSGDRLVGDSRCLGTQSTEGSLGARCPSGDGDAVQWAGPESFVASDGTGGRAKCLWEPFWTRAKPTSLRAFLRPRQARITLMAPARSQVLRGDLDPIFPPE